MRRVAALYLPMWPIERLRRVERRAGPPEPPREPLSLEPMQHAAAAEQVNACSVPRGGGWRPGARWARAEIAAKIEALPAHQRPSIRQLGRCDEAAGHPFKAMPPDEGSPPLSSPARGRWRVAPEGEVSDSSMADSPPPPSGFACQLPLAGEDVAVPLVTTIRDRNRIVIAAACPHARALGVAPGMALAQARVQVSGLDIRPADPEGDMAALRRLALLAARRWSPHVAVEGGDTVFLDLTGTAHLFGGEARMMRRIIALLARAGFSARIAVADTAGAAWALAHHGQGLVCPPGGHRDALAPLPVRALRIEESAIELLARLGVDSIGQLAAMPRGPLVRRFGRPLALRLDQALGDVAEPFDPIVPPEHIVALQRFAEPIATPDAIAHWLGSLVAKLVSALAQAGLGARGIELIAERVDGVPQRIRLGLARASRDPAHILRLLMRRIEEIEPGYGLDSLALHLRRAEPLGAEPFDERLDEQALPDLASLVDILATRIGLAAMWRSRPVESDVPERSVTSAPVLDPPERSGAQLKADDVRRLDRSPALHPWHPEWPKPARLLRRPERLDHVMAVLPDHAPRRFTWRGRLHNVIRSDGPERVHGEWWKRASESQSVRDYFRVEDEQGRRYWLFRSGDGERGVTGDLSWYLHGVFG